MSLHFATHHGIFEHWGQGAHLSRGQRAIFVICMTVLFLLIFVFL